MKKRFVIFLCLFLSMLGLLIILKSYSQDPEYEKLKLNMEELKTNGYKPPQVKIEKEELKTGKALVKMKEAEDLLNLAKKLMDQDLSTWDNTSWLSYHPGWYNPNTIKKLKQVIKKYPNSESAVEAKLRLAMIAEDKVDTREWGKQMLIELSDNYPNRWEGIWARLSITSYKELEMTTNEIMNVINDSKNFLPIAEKIEKNMRNNFNEFIKNISHNPNANFNLIASLHNAIAMGWCMLEKFDEAKVEYEYIIKNFANNKKYSKTALWDLKQINRGYCPYELAVELRRKKQKQEEKQCFDSIAKKYPYFANYQGERLLKENIRIEACDEGAMWAEEYVKCVENLEKRYPNLTTSTGEKLKGQKLLETCQSLRMSREEQTGCIETLTKKYSPDSESHGVQILIERESENVKDCEELDSQAKRYIDCTNKITKRYSYFTTPEGKKELEAQTITLSYGDCEGGIAWLKDFLKKTKDIELK